MTSGGVEPREPEVAMLAMRLYVAMVEQRNLEAQRYGEFQSGPVTPQEAWAVLKDVELAVEW